MRVFRFFERLLRAVGPDTRPAGTTGGHGQSGPGERGYQGQMTVGDEGGSDTDMRARRESKRRNAG